MARKECQLETLVKWVMVAVRVEKAGSSWFPATGGRFVLHLQICHFRVEVL